MAVKSTKKEGNRATRRSGDPSKISLFLDSSRFILGFLVLLFSVSVILLCSIDQSPVTLRAIPGEKARKTVTARFSYSYVSEIKTQRRIQELQRQVPPVYNVSLEHHQNFERFILDFLERSQNMDETLAALDDSGKEKAIEELTKTLNDTHSFFVSAKDVRSLLDNTEHKDREKILREGLMILLEISAVGVVDPDNSNFVDPTSNIILYRLNEDKGVTKASKVLTLVSALRKLNLNLRVLDLKEEIVSPLFRTFRKGLAANLIFDNEATQKRVAAITDKVTKVTVQVAAGDNLIESGKVITNLEYERFSEYFKVAKAKKSAQSFFNKDLLERSVLVIFIIGAALVYTRLSLPLVSSNNRYLAICGFAIIINLIAFRLLFEFGNTQFASNNPDFLVILPYLAPVSLASLIIAIMLGPSSAALVSLTVSALYSLIQGSNFEMLLISLLSSLTSVYFCRNVHFRTSVVRASTYAGLVMGICALIIGMIHNYEYSSILRHVVAGVLTGGATGIVVIGLLPLFEKVFNRTTDITLLELTDFNHPLLRRLQIEAPGTYHHSLMVASLSENAALEIGANPLICRVCSLFHDIGKLVKPEYFVENQREGLNPHIERNPSMSALVIKSHVKEGVDLAKRNKLPQVIIDVIRQHHGTSLIQYFYFEALKKQKGESNPPFQVDGPKLDLSDVEESTYRYDGPKPQFKESAIIHFADSVEAASRSLKKVNATYVDELLDKIFAERLKDNQLDECQFDFQDIAKIKKSFSFTLLNMLHSRIEYPGQDEKDDSQKKGKESVATSNAEKKPASSSS